MLLAQVENGDGDEDEKDQFSKLKIAAAARLGAPGSPSDAMILANCDWMFFRRGPSSNNSSAARARFSGVAAF